MARYAEGTTVSAEKSKVEIERLVMRYKANGFISGYQQGSAFVMFMLSERCIRFSLRLPLTDDREFAKLKPDSKRVAVEREERRRWRSLLLVIKAKLESCESGIETIDESFLAQIVMPNGETVGTWAATNIQPALKAGKMPDIQSLGWKE